MNDKESNYIDLESVIKSLIEIHSPRDRKSIYKIIRFINSQNKDRLNSKELKKLFRNLTKNWRKDNKKSNKYDPVMPISLGRLLKMKVNFREIIKSILPENGITILSGHPGNFKTWSTLHFAFSIAEGKLVYNHFETIKSNVLIIDEEDGIALLKKRAEILSANEKLNVYFMIYSGFKVDDEIWIERLNKYIRKYHIKVIIIDSLIRIHKGDENSSKDIAKMFEELRKLNKKGITILLNHHERKGLNGGSSGQSMRGSSDILAAIDCQMHITYSNHKLTITQRKNRYSEELKPFAVGINEEDKMYFTYLGEDAVPQSKANEATKHIIELLVERNEWVDRAEIDNRLKGKVGENNIGDALKELTGNYDIECKVAEKGKKFYRVRNNDSDIDDAF